MNLKKILNYLILFIALFIWVALKITIAEKKSQSKGAFDSNPTLYIYSYNNYFPDSVLKKFEKDFKCHIQYDYFASNEEMFAKLQAGATGYDVIVGVDYIMKAMIANELIIEIDKSKVPNIVNLASEFTHLPYDPEGKFTVPYKWGTTGVVYNTDKIKVDLKSWNDIFKPEYAGKISLLDDEREAIGSQMQSLGYSANSINMDELKIAQALLMKRKPLINVFASDSRQLLMTGDVWIAQSYMGDALQIARDAPHFKYINPIEGGVFWIDNMVIPKGARNKNLAHAFMNHLLDPEMEYINVKTLFYSSPNKMIENRQDLPATLKPSYVKNLDLKKIEFLVDLGIDSEKWDQIWTEIKSQ